MFSLKFDYNICHSNNNYFNSGVNIIVSKVYLFLVIVQSVSSSPYPHPLFNSPADGNISLIFEQVILANESESSPSTTENFRSNGNDNGDRGVGSINSANGYADQNVNKNRKSYRIGIISDLDQHSADSNEQHGVQWISYLREGNLILEQDKVNPYRSNISIEWDDTATHTIKSGLAYSSRGMELSTLNKFNNRLLSCDDRTGVIYELIKDKFNQEIIPTPWAILANGNYSGTGFKCEWAAVKNGELYVGSNGRDFPLDGKSVKSQKFVKKVTSHGEVTHLDWSDKYERMMEAVNIRYPGFIVHEAAGWSDIFKKWVFMPRYVSREEYDHESVRYAGSNIAFVADANFTSVQIQQIGRVKPTRSFSSFKWIPDTDDQLIVALKTLELDDEQETFIMAFDIHGNVIMKEKKIADNQKYEGIEFI